MRDDDGFEFGCYELLPMTDDDAAVGAATVMGRRGGSYGAMRDTAQGEIRDLITPIEDVCWDGGEEPGVTGGDAA